MKPEFLNQIDEAIAVNQHAILSFNTTDRYYWPEKDIGPTGGDSKEDKAHGISRGPGDSLYRKDNHVSANCPIPARAWNKTNSNISPWYWPRLHRGPYKILVRERPP